MPLYRGFPSNPIICTSTTRPTLPPAGTVIYETDTQKLFVYNGTAWDLPRNVAGGFLTGDLASMNATGAMALSKAAAEDVRAGPTTAIQTLANRRYKITALISTSIGGAWGYALLRIRRGTTVAGTQLSIKYFSRIGWQTMKVEAFDVPGAQASQQWCMTHQLDASVCDLYGPAGIWVEDVGAA